MCVVLTPFSNLRIVYAWLTLLLTMVDDGTIDILPDNILQKHIRF
jgi:hypothetical protein